MRTIALLEPALSPHEAVKRLDQSVIDLIATVQGLYAGSWTDCIEDVRRRRAGKPYLYRIDLPLSDELPWLAALHAYEQTHGRGSLCAAIDHHFHAATTSPS